MPNDELELWDDGLPADEVHDEITSIETWQAQPPVDAQIAFEDYKNLGPTRSVVALHKHYIALQSKDAFAPIPTDNLYVLQEWETRYNWKVLAWEHDAEAARVFEAHRKEVLSKVYSKQTTVADRMLQVAGKSMGYLEQLLEKEQGLTPDELLKFIKEGARIQREAAEAKLKLEDPREQENDTGGDFFDTIRKIGLLNVNQQINVYGNPQ